MKPSRISMILGLLVVASITTMPVQSQPFVLRAGILGGGAGIVAGPDLQVITTAGQPAAGFMLGEAHLAGIGVAPLLQIPSARDRKETARALLARHLDHPDANTRRGFEAAVKAVDRSLFNALWSIDGNHVFDDVVFDKEAKAVRDIARLLENENVGAQSRFDALEAVLRLIEADRILALIAIREADAACADLESPEEVNECDKGVQKAQESFTDADAQATAGAYDTAIQQYRKAWELAVDYGGLGKSGGVSIEGDEVPQSYSLDQNYPNPFNPSTTIRFSLPEPAHVRLRVFDALGRVVATIVESSLSAGSYRVFFNAGALPSGMYVYHLEAGDFTRSRRMILLK